MLGGEFRGSFVKFFLAFLVIFFKKWKFYSYAFYFFTLNLELSIFPRICNLETQST